MELTKSNIKLKILKVSIWMPNKKSTKSQFSHLKNVQRKSLPHSRETPFKNFLGAVSDLWRPEIAGGSTDRLDFVGRWCPSNRPPQGGTVCWKGSDGWLVVFFGEDLGRSKGRVGTTGVGLTDM